MAEVQVPHGKVIEKLCGQIAQQAASAAEKMAMLEAVVDVQAEELERLRAAQTEHVPERAG